MDTSEIVVYENGGSVHAGDAVRLYQARVVRTGLRACRRGFRLNRSYTPTNCLRSATTFTGKSYGRGNKALDQAIEDLSQWISACESSMPVRHE
jgi:hypothetical protein